MTSKIVYNIVMLEVNINEIKAKLSEYLDKVMAGETVIICKRNVPIAEIKAIEQPKKGQRPLGLARGQVIIHDSFFDPMTEEELALWEGKL
jgi:prevent-host-death family protein